MQSLACFCAEAWVQAAEAWVQAAQAEAGQGPGMGVGRRSQGDGFRELRRAGPRATFGELGPEWRWGPPAHRRFSRESESTLWVVSEDNFWHEEGIRKHPKYKWQSRGQNGGINGVQRKLPKQSLPDAIFLGSEEQIHPFLAYGQHLLWWLEESWATCSWWWKALKTNLIWACCFQGAILES